LEFTIRPNTNVAGWDDIVGRRDIPGVVAQVRESGRPMMIGEDAAAEVEAWITLTGWEPWEAPVHLERLE
jgi:hypothetical protein